jgi:hypothetical protein
VIWYLSIVLGFALIFSGYPFFAYEFEKPAIWIAITAVVFKHAWGIFAAVVFFGFIHRYGWFVRNIFNHPAWTILSRISFATFLCHIFVLKWMMSGNHALIYLGNLRLVS